MTDKPPLHNIQWKDVTSLRSLTLLLMPFLIAVGLIFVFASTLDGEAIETNAVGSHFRRETIVPVAVSLLLFFLATMSHVAWSQMLRAYGIKHWMIYGLVAWISLRAFWWLMHILLQSPFLVIYSDRLSSVGGNLGMIFTIILAISGLYISMRAALLDKHPRIMWICITFAAPFVSMIITVTATTSAGTVLYVYLFSDLCALLILGIGSWVFKLVSTRIRPSRDLKPIVEYPNLSSRGVSLLTVVIITLTLGIFSILVRQQLELHLALSLAINWAVVIIGASGVYLLLMKFSNTSMALQWIGLTVLMLLAIATYPDSRYLEYPNALDNAYLNDYARIISLITFLPIGFWVIAPLLIISIFFHASTELKTVCVGGMSAAPVMFALAQNELIMPSVQFNAMFVLMPTLALIAVGVVMFGFFELHRVDAGQFAD